MDTRVQRSLRLQVTCLTPPQADHADQPTEFGLQNQTKQLVVGMLQPDGALRYRCAVTVKPHVQHDAPDFAGPFVHGKPGARFLYLGWRRRDATDWIWRIKIPLASITSEQVEAAEAPGYVLAARIQGDRSGTVLLLDAGWTVENEET